MSNLPPSLMAGIAAAKLLAGNLVVSTVSVVSLIALMAFSSCGGRPANPTEESALTTGVVGAGVGAAVGEGMGSATTGAIIGASTGLTAGGIAGQARERNFEEQLAIQQRIIAEQEAEMKRQAEEIQDLKRQMYHNEGLRRFEQR